jgi:hypothetical protein
MGVSFIVGDRQWEIGSGSFLHAFFSTVSANLEPKGWGSKFPSLTKLYQGSLPSKEIDLALAELQTVKDELGKFPPSAVVWDIEDRSKRPPWGDKIASTITDLSNYFVTSNGKDLLSVLTDALMEAQKEKKDVSIE